MSLEAKKQHGQKIFPPTSDGDRLNWYNPDGNWHATQDIGGISIFAYQLEHQIGDLFAVNVYMRSSGASEFSYLLAIRAQGDTLTLMKRIGGGDRCFYSILSDAVFVRDGKLVFCETLTPYALMTFTGHDLDLRAFEDCPTCCTALAHYEFDLQSGKRSFLHVELIMPEIIQDSPFQRVYKEYLDKEKRILNASEVQEFISEVLSY